MDINITYETLFDLLRKERSLNELQPLDKSFWADVLTYLETLQSNPSSAPSEAEKLKLKIKNVKRIVKEIYEKREKKLTNIALNVVRTDASSFVDTQNMLSEEKTFFNELAVLLKSYKKGVLDRLFSGNLPDISEIESVKTNLRSSLDLEIKRQEFKTPRENPEEKPPIETVDREYVDEETDEDTEEIMEDEPLKVDDDARVGVKFTTAVPKFLGKNKDVFGPFKEGDEATLPNKIASILLNKGKIEYT